METPAAFELNQAIRRWRENLGHSAAFQPQNLDELESHLRDSIITLQRGGLSEAEAFYIATLRLGGAEQLNAEFSKTNAAAVWRRRAFWMLAGMLFWTVGADLISITKSLGIYAGSWVTTNGLLLGWVGGTLHLLSFVLVIACFIWLAKGRIVSQSKIGNRMLAQPKLFISLAIGFVLVLQITSPLLFAITFKRLAPVASGQRMVVEVWVSGLVGLLKGIAVFGGIIWLRRQPITKAVNSRLATGLLLVATMLGYSAPPGFAGDAVPKVVAGKESSATISEAIKLWRDGKQSDAVDKFLVVDFSKRPLFPTGSVLNLTEAEFIELPSAARDKMSKAMLADVQTIKLIAGRINESAKAARAAQDQSKATLCTSQLKAAGEAFDRPDGLALLKLVGQALKKMAAGSVK